MLCKKKEERKIVQQRSNNFQTDNKKKEDFNLLRNAAKLLILQRSFQFLFELFLSKLFDAK